MIEHGSRRALIVLVVILGCGAGPSVHHEPTDPAPAAAVLTWRERVAFTPGCPPDWTDSLEWLSCPFVRLQYPEVHLGAGDEASRRVNEWIEGELWAALDDGQRHESLDAASQEFLTMYEEFERASPGKGTWYLEVRVGALCEAARVLTLEATVSTYQGANHENSWRWLRSFATETGAPLRLGDLVDGHGVADVRRLAEAEFRRQKRLPAGRALADTNYFFVDDEFYLPDNFALGPEGLIFHFNAMEISSWSEGPTEIVIPYGAVDSDALRRLRGCAQDASGARDRLSCCGSSAPDP